jgi:hypothetical protein
LAAAWTARTAFAGGKGQPDSENRYPNVGAIVVTSGFPGVPFIAGSGVLIHPRVLLTAGHKSSEAEFLLDQGIPLFDHFRVNFGPDAFNPLISVEAVAVFTHPEHVADPLVTHGYNLAHDHDLGVIILKEPVDLPCATLPYEGLLDDLKDAGLLVDQGTHEKFDAVGYGATLEFPPPEEVLPPDGLRRFSSPEYRAVQTVWLLMNQNLAAGNSGIAAEDGGAPVFWRAPDGELVVVGISSQTDAARVSLFRAARTDLAESLDFINTILALVEGGAL